MLCPPSTIPDEATCTLHIDAGSIVRIDLYFESFREIDEYVYRQMIDQVKYLLRVTDGLYSDCGSKLARKKYVSGRTFGYQYIFVYRVLATDIRFLKTVKTLLTTMGNETLVIRNSESVWNPWNSQRRLYTATPRTSIYNSTSTRPTPDSSGYTSITIRPILEDIPTNLETVYADDTWSCLSSITLGTSWTSFDTCSAVEVNASQLSEMGVHSSIISTWNQPVLPSSTAQTNESVIVCIDDYLTLAANVFSSGTNITGNYYLFIGAFLVLLRLH